MKPSFVARVVVCHAAVLAACAGSAPPAHVAPPSATTTPETVTSSERVTRRASGPVATVRPVSETSFGTTVVDPYRWMEDGESAEGMHAWLEAEDQLTRSTLDPLPERAAAMTALRGIGPVAPRISGVEEHGGRWFYFKRGETLTYCMRDTAAGAERTLFDPASQEPGIGIVWAVPSADGKRVAYGVSSHGGDETVLHVMDVASGRTLPDTMDRLEFGGVSWVDSTRFLYTRLPPVIEGAPASEKRKRARVLVHELGRDASHDPIVFGPGVVDGIEVADADISIASAPQGSRWVFVTAIGGVRSENPIYYAPRTVLNGTTRGWTRLAALEDGVTEFDVRGDDAYMLTHHGAPRGQVVKVTLGKTEATSPTTVVPETNLVLEGLRAGRDALYIRAMDAGVSRVERVGLKAGAAVETLALPFDGSVTDLFASVTDEGATFVLEGWSSSPRVQRYDTKTASVRELALQSEPASRLESVTSEEARAASADGTMVPLSIIHSRDFAKDGRHPTRLVAYAAYGTILRPYFRPQNRHWYDLGGVVAICHARGGGELGEAWHEGGKLANKHHSVEDVIGCARWLVDNHYAEPDTLAVEGGSAGGIAAAGAITARPDLFGAAILRVGILDPLRFEQSSNVQNVPEIGTSATEDGFRSLLAMDPYLHVKDGERYPAVLITTGAHDTRVPPWQSFKMAARLQAATSSGRPVLLRVDGTAGHGMSSAASTRDQQLADEEAFLLWQLRPGQNKAKAIANVH